MPGKWRAWFFAAMAFNMMVCWYVGAPWTSFMVWFGAFMYVMHVLLILGEGDAR